MKGSVRRWSRSTALLVSIALALRLAAVLAWGGPCRAATGSTWEWGHEAACLAHSLIEHGAYGDPFCQRTGPSAWLTPPFPALLALILAAGGGVTPAAALLLQVFQAALSASTCALLVVLGRRLGLERAGRLAGWMWALYPLALWHAARTVWDTTAVAWGVPAFLVVLSSADGSVRASVRVGVALGALVFLSPVTAALAPVAVAWMSGGAHSPAQALRNGLLCCISALGVCLPWMVRNELALGTPALRTNFGVALRLGNGEAASGAPVPFREHPALDAAELARLRALGEVGYDRDSRSRALAWIGAHPARFARLSAERLRGFWLGRWPDRQRGTEEQIEPGGDWESWLGYGTFLVLAALALGGALAGAAQPAARALLGGAALLYGIPYCLTHVSERYRFPIDPLLALLAACLLIRLSQSRRARGLG